MSSRPAGRVDGSLQPLPIPWHPLQGATDAEPCDDPLGCRPKPINCTANQSTAPAAIAAPNFNLREGLADTLRRGGVE